MLKTLKNKLTKDRFARLPRIWSNNELSKFSHLFTGDIINVSGWKDYDKNGKYYIEYFENNSKYFISNANLDSGIQNFDNELDINLIDELPENLENRFDVCFNHTVLEHIYEVDKAFSNICKMSNDIVILVTPFSQAVHYAKDKSWLDYWRLTPFAIEKMYKENGLELLYMNSNDNIGAGSYIFSIATKKKDKWKGKHKDFNKIKYDCDCGTQTKWFRILFNLLKV